MSISHSQHNLPAVYVLQEQITFVTDNDRDAEALSCKTDTTVVVKRPKNVLVEPISERPDVPTLRTSETSERANVPNGSDVFDVQDVIDVFGAPNVSGVPGVENLPDALDVSDIPNVQTPLL